MLWYVGLLIDNYSFVNWFNFYCHGIVTYIFKINAKSKWTDENLDKILVHINFNQTLKIFRCDKKHLQVYDSYLIKISNLPSSTDSQDTESNYIVFQDSIWFDFENFKSWDQPILEYLLKLLVSHYTWLSEKMVRITRALQESTLPSTNEFFSDYVIAELT